MCHDVGVLSPTMTAARKGRTAVLLPRRQGRARRGSYDCTNLVTRLLGHPILHECDRRGLDDRSCLIGTRSVVLCADHADVLPSIRLHLRGHLAVGDNHCDNWRGVHPLRERSVNDRPEPAFGVSIGKNAECLRCPVRLLVETRCCEGSARPIPRCHTIRETAASTGQARHKGENHDQCDALP